MIVLGIDPGVYGALAVLREEAGQRRVEEVVEMPSYLVKEGSKARRINARELVRTIQLLAARQVIDKIVIEHVQPFPGIAAVRIGVLMEAFGAALCATAFLDKPTFQVRPQDWKKVVLVGTARDKQAAITYVRQAYPAFVLPKHPVEKGPHDGVADAICLAEYGLRN
jgi:Holliday junction resolvasome RuvABC endonuclease subunit